MNLIRELPNKCDKIIAFSMIYLSSLYADDSGEFNAKELTINRLTDISYKQIERVLNKLIDLDYVKCIYRNRLKQITYDKRKYTVSKFPNRYKLSFLQPDCDQIIYRFEKVDTKVINLVPHFWTCYSEYLNQCGLRPTRREKENIEIFVKSIANKLIV